MKVPNRMSGMSLYHWWHQTIIESYTLRIDDRCIGAAKSSSVKTNSKSILEMVGAVPGWNNFLKMMHHDTPNFLGNWRSVSTTIKGYGFNFFEVSKKGTKNVSGGPVDKGSQCGIRDPSVVKGVAQRPTGCQFVLRAQNFWLKGKY